MNRGQRTALLVEVARELLARGSWCGETHIQKATFILQEVVGVETGFDFVLYKHGPFSFELRDTIQEMTGDGLVEYIVRHPAYGPTINPTTEAEAFLERFPKTISKYSEQVRFVAENVRNKGVSELERLATAAFLLKHLDNASTNERADELVRLKPHISLADATQACEDAGQLFSDAASYQVSRSS